MKVNDNEEFKELRNKLYKLRLEEFYNKNDEEKIKEIQKEIKIIKSKIAKLMLEDATKKDIEERGIKLC